MAGILFTNFARSQLAAPLLAGDLSLTVETGHGARFPSPGASEYFYLVLENAALDREIVKCTGRAVDTLTVVRAQDNTTALGWNAGDVVALRMVAAALNDAIALAAGEDFALLAGADFTGPVTMASTLDVTGLLSADGGVEVPVDQTGSNARRADQTIWNVGGAARFPTWTTAGRPATPADGDTGKNTDLGCNETWSAAYSAWIQEGLQSGASASLAGTAFDFTGAPAWATEVSLKFYGASTNGTSEPLFQAITGAAVTSGYVASTTGTASTASVSRSSAAGVQLTSTAAANVMHGEIVLKRSKASAFKWLISGEVQVVGQTGTMTVSGYIDLGAGVLTGIRATTTGGVNTFDAGTGVLSWRA